MSRAAAAESHQLCPTLCDPIDGSPPGSHPWDSPGKNTGVGCHFLLQCMKVKSETEVAQSCPTLRDPMDCSLPGSSVHGISKPRVLEWVAIASSTQGMRNLLFLHLFAQSIIINMVVQRSLIHCHRLSVVLLILALQMCLPKYRVY